VVSKSSGGGWYCARMEGGGERWRQAEDAVEGQTLCTSAGTFEVAENQCDGALDESEKGKVGSGEYQEMDERRKKYGNS